MCPIVNLDDHIPNLDHCQHDHCHRVVLHLQSTAMDAPEIDAVQGGGRGYAHVHNGMEGVRLKPILGPHKVCTTI